MCRIVRWMISCCGLDRNSESQKLSQIVSQLLSKSYNQHQSHDLVDNLHGRCYQTVGNCMRCSYFAQVERSKKWTKHKKNKPTAETIQLLEMVCFDGNVQNLNYRQHMKT